MDTLIALPAREVVRLLQAREVSPLEAIDAALARIAEVDGDVNAVNTLCPERARERATVLADAQSRSGRGWLAGLPFLVKDLVEVEGVRTTYGSPIFADHVPDRSAFQIERVEGRGGIVLGKSAAPEFGAGANTFNEVFGVTRNPWDTRLTCGGSSGGAAVALATGMAWLADGSDLGGSLRTPASFCGIVGLRPSPGRVAEGLGASFDSLGVVGPMARDVRDAALFLDALAGLDRRDPRSFPAPPLPYAESVERPPALRRVAFSPDLGGIIPVDPEVAAICRRAAERLAAAGVVVEEASPDLSTAREVFSVLRAAGFAAGMWELLRDHRELLKPEIVWNIELGLSQSAARVAWAERERGLLIDRFTAFSERYDLLLCPAAIVPPFPVEQRYVEELGDHRFETYVDWIVITSAVTLTARPVLALPAGFTSSGLPVGLQLVGPARGEGVVLAAGALLEGLLDARLATPIDPRVPSGR
jgi:amidase